MRIDIQTETRSANEPVRVGNVYAVRGGRGSREKHMNVLIAISEEHPYSGVRCFFLTVNKQGSPVGTTTYALHYVEDLCPIAFVDGLEDFFPIMRSL